MGGDASTGLGSTDHHSLQDMRCSEADDRPTGDTTRKSLFPADKTLHSSTEIFKKLIANIANGERYICGTIDFYVYNQNTVLNQNQM